MAESEQDPKNIRTESERDPKKFRTESERNSKDLRPELERNSKDLRPESEQDPKKFRAEPERDPKKFQAESERDSKASSLEFLRDPNELHILIGVTGSVAAIKIPELVQEFRKASAPRPIKLRLVTTERALHFFDPKIVECDAIFTDQDEWSLWNERGDPVLHIELRRWADVFVISPLDANTMGKIANGICDNLLTCVARAWDPKMPLLFAPAMNTMMFDHPLTGEHRKKFIDLGYHEIPCVEKIFL